VLVEVAKERRGEGKYLSLAKTSLLKKGPREGDTPVCGFIFTAFCEGFDAVPSFGLVERAASIWV
jgi:hypothetical protein